MRVPIFNNHAVEIISFGTMLGGALLGTVVKHDDGTTEWVDDDTFATVSVRVRGCEGLHGHYFTLLADEIVLREMSGPDGLGWCCRTLLREVRFGDPGDES